MPNAIELFVRVQHGHELMKWKSSIGRSSSFSEDLLGQALQSQNLETAWKRVRANKGAVGIDGMTIDDFPA